MIARKKCARICVGVGQALTTTSANNHTAEAMTVRAVVLDLLRTFGITTNQFV